MFLKPAAASIDPELLSMNLYVEKLQHWMLLKHHCSSNSRGNSDLWCITPKLDRSYCAVADLHCDSWEQTVCRLSGDTRLKSCHEAKKAGKHLNLGAIVPCGRTFCPSSVVSPSVVSWCWSCWNCCQGTEWTCNELPSRLWTRATVFSYSFTLLLHFRRK